jgi:hypothetical protein
LISLLPAIKENPKYQGQDKLPVTIWVIAQVNFGFSDNLIFPVWSFQII